jgi:hypothetical protein
VIPARAARPQLRGILVTCAHTRQTLNRAKQVRFAERDGTADIRVRHNAHIPRQVRTLSRALRVLAFRVDAVLIPA